MLHIYALHACFRQPSALSITYIFFSPTFVAYIRENAYALHERFFPRFEHQNITKIRSPSSLVDISRLMPNRFVHNLFFFIFCIFWLFTARLLCYVVCFSYVQKKLRVDLFHRQTGCVLLNASTRAGSNKKRNNFGERSRHISNIHAKNWVWGTLRQGNTHRARENIQNENYSKCYKRKYLISDCENDVAKWFACQRSCKSIKWWTKIKINRFSNVLSVYIRQCFAFIVYAYSNTHINIPRPIHIDASFCLHNALLHRPHECTTTKDECLRFAFNAFIRHWNR